MGRNRIFYITKALMLSSCMMFGLFVTTGTVTAYAASDGNQEAENSDKSGNNRTAFFPGNHENRADLPR